LVYLTAISHTGLCALEERGHGYHGDLAGGTVPGCVDGGSKRGIGSSRTKVPPVYGDRGRCGASPSHGETRTATEPCLRHRGSGAAGWILAEHRQECGDSSASLACALFVAGGRLDQGRLSEVRSVRAARQGLGSLRGVHRALATR
ncbi:unnamed protein product, partial [Ectocarpus fasciculatus]